MSTCPDPLIIEVSCLCTRDSFGSVYCDAHRPPPPPDPDGACCLCHFVGDEADLITGKDGLKWHQDCVL